MSCANCSIHRRPMPLPEFSDIPSNAILVITDSPDEASSLSMEMNTRTDSHRLLNSALKKFLKDDMGRVIYDYAIRCCVDDMPSIPVAAYNACRNNYFYQLVDRVKPDCIIVAGNTALRIATGKSGITKKCNQVINITVNGIEYPVVPVLSPGFVLRDANQMQRFASTVKYAVAIATNKKTMSVMDLGTSKVNYNPTAAEIRDFRHRLQKPNGTFSTIAFDVETTSLSPYVDTDFRILSIAVSTETEALVIPVDYPGEYEPITPRLGNARCKETEAVSAMLDLLHNDKVPKVGHNVKYDCHCIRTRFMNDYPNFEVQNIIGDTLLLHKHLFAVQGGHDLKTVISDMLGCSDYSEELTEYIRSGADAKKYAKIPYNVLAKYNASDVLATMHIWNKMINILVKRSANTLPVTTGALPYVYSMAKVYKLMMRAYQSTYEIETFGIYPRTEYITQLDKQLEVEKETALQNCLNDPMVVRDKLLQQAAEQKVKDFNPNSDKQVRFILFESVEGYNETSLTTTAGGAPSVAGDVLRALIIRKASCAALCEQILAYRKVVKHQGTFVKGFLDATSPMDGRVHGRLNLFGAVTARLSSDDPNLQNVPREKVYRDMLGVPEGFALIEADYSQIELRILAAYSNDPVMLDVYRTGRDLHLETAAHIYGCATSEVTKEMRTSAKAVNFGIAYGLTAHGLSAQLTDLLEKEVTREEADGYIRGFFSLYPGVAKWQEAIRKHVTEHGSVCTMFGTVRPLQNATVNTRRASYEVKQVYEEAIRHAVNTPIQGTAGLCTLFALDSLHRKFKTTNEGTPVSNHRNIVSTVHDSILVQTPMRLLRDTLIDMKTAMIDLPRTMLRGTSFCNVPLVVDFKVGSAWGSMRELNWKGK